MSINNTFIMLLKARKKLKDIWDFCAQRFRSKVFQVIQ